MSFLSTFLFIICRSSHVSIQTSGGSSIAQMGLFDWSSTKTAWKWNKYAPGEGGCTPKSANTNICLFESFRNRVLTETKVRRECSINVFLILSKRTFVLQKLSILGLNQYISSKFGNELVQVRSRDAAGWATKPTTGRLPLSNWFLSRSRLNVNQSGHNACSSEGNHKV